MMRRPGRLVVALVVSAVVTAGCVTAALADGPNVVASCSATSSTTSFSQCKIDTQDITDLDALQLVVTLESGDGQDDQYVGVNWTGECVPNGNANGNTPIAPATNPPPKTPISTDGSVTINVPLPFTDPVYCNVSATATLYALIKNGTTWDELTPGSITMQMQWDQKPGPSAPPSPSPSASPSSSPNNPLVKGYGGKCLDDKGNKSANRTEVILWTCNSADASQSWKFTNSELVHNGKCADDPATGPAGTKLILWTCTHAANQTWSHTSSNGEFVLSSRSHGQLCLTDPGHSTTNRTQLTVAPCRNTTNQHWT
jgi:hypothetical protein